METPPEPAPPLIRYEMMAILVNREPTPADEFAAILERHREFLAAGGGGGRWETFVTEGGTATGVILGVYLPADRKTIVADRLVAKMAGELPGAASGPAEQAGLAHARLDGLDLRGVDLSYADLCGASARGQDLGGANLEGCLATDSDFAGANFQRANLARADFSRSDLSGCDFRDANLAGTDLEQTDLTGADLRGADLTGARLPGARMDNVRR